MHPSADPLHQSFLQHLRIFLHPLEDPQQLLVFLEPLQNHLLWNPGLCLLDHGVAACLSLSPSNQDSSAQEWILKSFCSCICLGLLGVNPCIPGSILLGGSTSGILEAPLEYLICGFLSLCLCLLPLLSSTLLAG